MWTLLKAAILSGKITYGAAWDGKENVNHLASPFSKPKYKSDCSYAFKWRLDDAVLSLLAGTEGRLTLIIYINIKCLEIHQMSLNKNM